MSWFRSMLDWLLGRPKQEKPIEVVKPKKQIIEVRSDGHVYLSRGENVDFNVTARGNFTAVNSKQSEKVKEAAQKRTFADLVPDDQKLPDTPMSQMEGEDVSIVNAGGRVLIEMLNSDKRVRCNNTLDVKVIMASDQHGLRNALIPSSDGGNVGSEPSLNNDEMD